MAITKIFTTLLTLITVVSALPANAYDTVLSTAVACTTGEPVVTAGYTINYAIASPTALVANAGYQPDSSWASDHVVATYTYGVFSPQETGFAYSQFKCQYTCNAAPLGSSFFVEYVGGSTGSLCSCYDEILAEETFVSGNQTLVGGWNAICGVTHSSKN